MYAAMRRARVNGLRTALVYCKEQNLPFYQSLDFSTIDRAVEYVKPFADVEHVEPIQPGNTGTAPRRREDSVASSESGDAAPQLGMKHR